jgi:broad specificity phosphatase PhoE
MKTIVHLLRHGEVHNPEGILYGRLPGYHLSDDGRLMAEAAAKWLDGRDVTALYCSPMERAQETAEPLSTTLGLEVVTDDRLIEAANHFEGHTFGIGDGSLRRARHWPYLWNPFRPSWGEPYEVIAHRMLDVMADAREAARGHEAVCVSHQLPIWVTRRKIEGRRLWHNPAKRECALASVTSVTYDDDRVVKVDYAEPAGELSRRPSVPGA